MSHKKGFKHSEETKQKISLAKLGKWAGKDNPMHGKHHTAKTIEKISKTMKGRYTGKNNPMYGVHRFGKDSANWKGGRKAHVDGYVLIYSPDHPNRMKNNYMFEHRLVMEKQQGRYLNNNEVAHHINGIKDDNRTKNLQLMTKSDHKSLRKLKCK